MSMIESATRPSGKVRVSVGRTTGHNFGVGARGSGPTGDFIIYGTDANGRLAALGSELLFIERPLEPQVVAWFEANHLRFPGRYTKLMALQAKAVAQL